MWADPSLPPLAGYLNAVATGYGAGLAQAPFLTDPAKAASQVNQVISADTRGHISKLVTPGMLTDVGWVLTSALYLDAKWAAPFDPSKTAPDPFTAAGGQTVTASYLDGDGFAYAKSGGWTAVSLPYAGGKLTMTALLPPAGSASCALPTQAGLARSPPRWAPAVPVTRRTVYLPKVNLAVNGETGRHEGGAQRARHGAGVHQRGGLHRAVAARRASWRSSSRPRRSRWRRRARSPPPLPPSASTPRRRSTTRSPSGSTART